MSTSVPAVIRCVLSLSATLMLLVGVGSCGSEPPQPPAQSQPTPVAETAITNPDEAIQRLRDGNQRFVGNAAIDPNQTDARRLEVAGGQHPFATILGCVDSRVSPEIVFDRGLGDLFVIRTAGHVLDNTVVGSIEFGSEEFGIPLVMVLGHERCGALEVTIEALEKHETIEGSIGAVVAGVTPAVEAAKGRSGDLLDNSVRANIELTVNRLKQSPVLKEAVDSGKIKIVGGRYDLETGLVEFTVQ